ncbi:holo-ACP synthase [Candidatus Protochlamydia phocaeensis]|uniref:holo-ACP synthase n=1 Tax=Candidatus Protochlamydia phocaeensis TaxID=1414722 RepID=UPI0008389612|nr:holo-ACP synthase [Candidatus Protochlamydia phocaeensis]
MILGIGNDIIEVARIKANLERYKQRFIDRVFTPQEQEYCLSRKEPALHFAGRFAAKEAIVKALGTGFSQGITWLDIEIKNDSNGKPCAIISPHLADLFGCLPFLHISISHCHTYATAFAIWVKEAV